MPPRTSCCRTIQRQRPPRRCYGGPPTSSDRRLTPLPRRRSFIQSFNEAAGRCRSWPRGGQHRRVRCVTSCRRRQTTAGTPPFWTTSTTGALVLFAGEIRRPPPFGVRTGSRGCWRARAPTHPLKEMLSLPVKLNVYPTALFLYYSNPCPIFISPLSFFFLLPNSFVFSACPIPLPFSFTFRYSFISYFLSFYPFLVPVRVSFPDP